MRRSMVKVARNPAGITPAITTVTLTVVANNEPTATQAKKDSHPIKISSLLGWSTVKGRCALVVEAMTG